MGGLEERGLPRPGVGLLVVGHCLEEWRRREEQKEEQKEEKEETRRRCEEGEVGEELSRVAVVKGEGRGGREGLKK